MADIFVSQQRVDSLVNYSMFFMGTHYSNLHCSMTSGVGMFKKRQMNSCDAFALRVPVMQLNHRIKALEKRERTCTNKLTCKAARVKLYNQHLRCYQGSEGAHIKYDI